MQDERKTKQELLAELRELRARVAEHDPTERLSRLIQASPEPLILVQLGPAKNRVLDVNEGFVRLSGYARDEVVGRFGVDLGWWKNPEDQRELMAVFAAHGEVRRWEGEFVTKGGEVLTCELSVFPVDVGDHLRVLVSVRDLSERKRAEAALRERETRLSSILRAAPVGIGTARDRVMTEGNDRFCQMLGYTRDELVGRSTRLVYATDEEFQRVGRELSRQLGGGDVALVEARFRRQDGSLIDVLLSAARRDPDDPGDDVTMIALDITHRKQGEEALRASERRFRALFDQSVQLGAVLQPDGRLLTVNRTALGFLTADQSPGIGRPFWETPWWSHSEALRDALRGWVRRAAAGETVPFESTHFDRAGVLHVVSATMSPIRDEAENVIYLLALGHDVTERKRLEREILEVRARERQRIGQDLHDGLGQQLTGMGFLARALERKLEARSLAEAEDARALQERTAEALAQTRLLARGLLPISFDPAGLAAALEELAVSARDLFHFECDPLIDPAVRVDNEDVALHLYHIAREAVTNAARHANPRRVIVQLAQTDEGARLTITDDGSGIPDVQQRGEGSGLRIMGYRAHLMQGSIAVERGPERGTVVRCDVPLAAETG
jgi:PAS domain S-box-containing protein